MIGKSSWVAVGALVALLSSPAVADERGPGGTLGLAPSASWAMPMTDEEMGELRGGFMGLAFSVMFNGMFDSLTGTTTGDLVVSTDGTTTVGGTTIESAQVTDGVATARLRAHVGEFNGTSGFFQIGQLIGDNSILHNEMIVNISIVQVFDPAQASALLQSLSGF